MKQNRFLAIILSCLLLLTGCGSAQTEGFTKEDSPTIAYVPLDDRPDNEERVIYLAESLGYELNLPTRDDYRTRLNGQPLNENGTQSGDRAALYEWVLTQETAGCDRYILSMDQLLSGGLVNSRAMSEHQDITLSDGRTLTEFQLLETLLETLASDPENHVWLLDSVMRLAPTVGYQHWDLNGYNALRKYGMAGRPVLSGDALTLDNIRADYRLDNTGRELPLLDFGLNEEEVTEYLSARTRKLTLTDRIQTLVQASGYENFRVLIGIDDSSVEDSIQKNEIAYLRQNLRDGDALLSGVDDLAFKAVAKLFLEEQEHTIPRVAVSYYGDTEHQPACAYDYQPLTHIVEEHIDFFDLEHTTDIQTADIHMLVLTQPADPEKKEEYYNALIRQLNENEQAQRPTILIDAGNGQYGTTFHEALTAQSHLGWLLSYSGFLDMAIVTGTAMSHGIARYVFLQECQPTDSTEYAFIQTVADSILKDFCYKHIVRNDLLGYIRNDLSGNPDNYWQPNIDRDAIQSRLEQGMATATSNVIQNLEHSNFISSLSPYSLRGWGNIVLDNYRFPWDRAFEIGMDIHLDAFTEAQETIFAS